jgi:deoxycytidylate deaminase
MKYNLINPITENPNRLDYSIESLGDDISIISLNQISNKHKKYIFEAMKLAKKSNLRQKHGSVIVHNGDIIASGYNNNELGTDVIFSRHAEFDSISKIKRLRNINKNLFANCTIYIVRISTENNSLKCSKPCLACMQYILKCGIKKIIYSNDIENF